MIYNKKTNPLVIFSCVEIFGIPIYLGISTGGRKGESWLGDRDGTDRDTDFTRTYFY